MNSVLDEIALRINAEARQLFRGHARDGRRSPINMRARTYRNPKRRFELDLIKAGMSILPPDRLLLRAEAALDRSAASSGLVQIVPVRLINARAALLLARYERFLARKQLQEVA